MIHWTEKEERRGGARSQTSKETRFKKIVDNTREREREVIKMTDFFWFHLFIYLWVVEN